MSNSSFTEEKKILVYSAILPLVFIVCLWFVKLVEVVLNLELAHLGVHPRTLNGLWGIIFSPFIHSDSGHLMSNSVPLLVLATGTIYFYRALSYRVFLIVWLVGGLCLWLGGRPYYHIGASGLVYGLAFFLFFSGVIRRDTRLAALSFIVVFLYGGLIWGIFPIWPNISWEGHLFGGATGLACAIIYRNDGPERKKYLWELEDEDLDQDFTNEPTECEQPPIVK